MALGVRADNLIGKRFGRLEVIEYAGLTSDKKVKWTCKCDCGSIKTVRAASLKSGNVKSCGCLLKESRQNTETKPRGKKSHFYKHGLCYSRINGIYRKMKQRCKSKNNIAYDRYGGRGIKICDEWDKNFMSFYKWSLNHGYSEGMTIDRINNDGDYSPDNCRWVTHKVQQNNRSNNVFIEYNGESHTLSEWADIVGISKKAIYHRYERNWDTERMLNYYGTEIGGSTIGSTGYR